MSQAKSMFALWIPNQKIFWPKKKNIKDKVRNLFKFVSVLLSALVQRVGVSRMRDFLYGFPN